MRGNDRGRAFLKIMRRTERTPEKEALYRSTVRDVPYPVQVVWAADDPALKLSVYGDRARVATGLKAIHTIPGKLFPQEDETTRSPTIWPRSPRLRRHCSRHRAVGRGSCPVKTQRP